MLGEVEGGLCVLLGIARGDDESAANTLARKLAQLRIFPDDEGRFSHSVRDVGGSVLVVSQFTLLGDSNSKSATPDFSAAAPRDQAEPLYDLFIETLRDLGLHVETGRFGAHMQVSLVNDGPVTLILEA